jgi:hypothetical protein
MLVKISETRYIDPKDITEMYVAPVTRSIVVKLKNGEERLITPDPLLVHETLNHLAEQINSALQLQEHQ